jgi:hypothetical protein
MLATKWIEALMLFKVIIKQININSTTRNYNVNKKNKSVLFALNVR